MTLKSNVLVVGAGIAGCAVAKILASTHSVLLIDQSSKVPPRIGESLPGAARMLLDRLGVREAVGLGDHRASLGQASLWGEARVCRRDCLNDPYGHGWCLDRSAFEETLRRAVASSNRVHFLVPARLLRLVHQINERSRWKGIVRIGNETTDVECKFVVFAGGRRPNVSLRSLAATLTFDRLVCRYVVLEAASSADALTEFSLVEACAEGWWYRASLPSGQRVLAYHTDVDLPSARVACDRDGFSALLQDTRMFAGTRLPPDVVIRGASARSQALSVIGDSDWCAVGDAACAFDPIVAQGMFNALYTGVRAGEAISASLHGDSLALPLYQQQVMRVIDAYRQNLLRVYSAERRFDDSDFWRRRRAQAIPRGQQDRSSMKATV